MSAVATPPISVLLVEDNPGDARLILEFLRDAGTGFELEMVDRLAPALERLGHAGVDVVLLDLGLPDSTGLETFEATQRAAPDEAIVVISGLDDERVALQAVRAGAQDYLVKGRIEGRLLARVIRYAIERKHAQQALLKEQARFRALVDNSYDAIAVFDTDGIILYASSATRRIIGYAPTELLGRNGFELVHPESEADFAASLAECVQRPGEPVLTHARVRHKDGTWRFLEGVFTNLLAEPSVRGIVNNYRDVTDRKRAEERIRWLSLAVEQSPVSVIMTDLTGKIEYVNAKFTELSGYTPDEALHKNPRFLQSGRTTVEAYRTLWTTILAGGTWHGEIENRRKDGSPYWIDATICPIREPDGRVTHFVGLQRDVTAHRAAEQALREREERFRQIAENIREVFFVVDAQFRETLYISPAYETVWGLSCQSVYDDPRSFVSSVPGEDRQRLVASIASVQRGEDAGEIEFRVVRPTGEVRFVLSHAVPIRNAQGEVYRIAAVALDITERKVADEALRASETYHRTILENIGDAVFVADRDGRYIDVNPRACELTGYTRDELLQLEVADTYPPERREEAARRVREVASGMASMTERPLLRKDGTSVIVEVSARSIDDGRLLATLRDITDRRHLEQQLRQAQKMEAIGRLAGGVAHDFNNVLTAIFGYVDLLHEELPATSGAQQDLTEVRKAAERAAGLTRQLLAFSRQQVLEPVVLNPNELVMDFEKMLRRVIGEDIELRLALAPDIGNVRADPGQLHQVIMNLIVNARDAMPGGGKLLVETANADLTEQYAELHQPVVPGPYIMLAVSDTGTGMTAEVKSRIFEPFFTTKEKGKGTGLGLSTVYGIVKQSGGYIWVYSEPGRGTTFKIFLQRADAPAEPLTRPKEVGSLTGTETILLAEDDAILRPLAKGLLEKLGYTVLAAENGDDALAVAAAHAGALDLLVADVVMPGVSGRELARRLTKTRPGTRVLFVSGYTDDAIVRHGMLEPGLNFLQKPFTPAVLARKVREVLDAK